MTLVACESNNTKPDNDKIIINELMASNRTGILNDKNKPADWIELKNIGQDSIDLKDFKLIVIKDSTKGVLSSQSQNNINQITGDSVNSSNIKVWSFPSLKIGGGKCLVLFADKSKKGEENPFQINLKLPKEGATVQLISPNDKLLSEVKYNELQPDQSFALQPDSTLKATYWQSPGFENNREGYEAAIQKIDSQRSGPLLIWEVMSRAQHSYDNWVELKNISEKPVNLAEYSLSKKPGKDQGWNLPEKTLAPGEFISFQLAGGKANPKNNNQVPFKLGDTETIVLSKNGKFVDGVCAKLSPYGMSIGRMEGKKGFFFLVTPTRNAENKTSGYSYIMDKPEWNITPGVYKNDEKIVLKLINTEHNVHYTVDGSEPTLNSPLFKDSIVITKPTVVRSFAEGDSITLPSNVATASFLIGVNHDLPVINISLNPNDMYGHTNGIYADGPGYGGDFPYQNANFWKNWTKKAHMELFDGEKMFSSDCGLKIFGAFSRALPKKSFRIKFRGEFGEAKVNYDFFDNGQYLEWEDLVLRSGSQDYNANMIKDEFFTSLALTGNPSMMAQIHRPVALYINAEYFGLYYLREKIDKNFVARKLNIPTDSIDVFLSGASPYRDLVTRITNLDIRQNENFEYARKNIDFESLIDYKIGNIYAGKTDVGNIRHVRSRHPDSDGKWRFVFYDIDYSWSPDGKPSASMYLSSAPGAIVPEKIFQNVLISHLLRNNEFRQIFLERLSYHLTNTYSADNATAHFDKFINQIQNEMKLNCERWPTLSYERWQKNIGNFRSRFENRPKVILNDIRNHLKITKEENKKYFSHLGY